MNFDLYSKTVEGVCRRAVLLVSFLFCFFKYTKCISVAWQHKCKFIYLSLVWLISRAELLHCADMSSVLPAQPVQQTEPSAGSQRRYSWAWWAPCSWPWRCDEDTLWSHEAFEVYFAEFWLINGKLRKSPLQTFIGFSFCIENRNLRRDLDEIIT